MRKGSSEEEYSVSSSWGQTLSSTSSTGENSADAIGCRSKTNLQNIYVSPFISLKLMSIRDLELSPLKFGRVKPLMLVHLLNKYVDPLMKLGQATHGFSCRCWISLLWPLFYSLSSSWTPKPMEYIKTSRDSDGGDDEDADFVTVPMGEPKDDDNYDYDDTSVAAVDFGFKVVWKDVSVHFPVHVWKMLADTKDGDLRASWLQETLPRLMRCGQQSGIENVEKGRLGSVHLLALARRLFAAAELDCIGMVEVKNGEITEQSFQQFEKDERDHLRQMRKKSPSYRRPRITRDVLDEQLRDAKLKFAAAGGANFKYLVADIYVMPEPENWDDYESKVPNIYGTMMLLEYLLQTLIGKSARDWTPEDVDNRINEKKSQLSRSAWFENLEAIAETYGRLCT